MSVLGFPLDDIFFTETMVMRRAYSVCLLTCLALAPPSLAHHIKQSSSKTMPVTTSSPKARDLFDRALTDYENLYLERANIGWRAPPNTRSRNEALATATHSRSVTRGS